MFFAASSFSDQFDRLLFDATRYANTPEKREAKRIARDELKSRMPEALRAAMKHMHGDSVGLQVITMEWVLEQPSDVVTPVMLDFIDNENTDTRRVAIYFMGFHETPEHAQRIMKYLDDEDCRGAAIRTLGKWKIKDAREPIEYWLANGKERIKVVSANALRDIGDPACLPALVTAMNDPLFTVRNTAARAIVSFGDQAVDRLKPDEKNDTESLLTMKKRCLADLGQLPLSETIDSTNTYLDGKFFLP
jgi:hypothetical protein